MSYVVSIMMFFSNLKPAEVLPACFQKGKASFYAKKFNGRRTAYGERVCAEALEGAHRSLPLNTWVEVTNLANQRSVIVRINDRGPFAKGRVIDLTYAAARAIGMVSKGVANVSLRVVGKGRDIPAQTAGRFVFLPTFSLEAVCFNLLPSKMRFSAITHSKKSSFSDAKLRFSGMSYDKKSLFSITKI